MKFFKKYTLPRTMNLLFGGIFVALFFVAAISQVPVVHAALDTGINQVDQTIQLSGADPRIIIAQVIRVALGLLGIVALGIVLYAGFLWMTAGGDEDKIADAKRMLVNGVIGLVIILSSFAITQFILTKLVEATNTQGGNNNNNGGGAGIGNVLPRDAFLVQTMNPANPAPELGWPRNSVVRIRMNQPVDPQSVLGNIKIIPIPGQDPITQTVVTDTTTIVVTPTTLCPEPNADRFCFSANTKFHVVVESGLSSMSTHKSVSCSNFNPCTVDFSIGNYVDTKAPNVTITVPVPTQSISVGTESLRALAADDSGVSQVTFKDSAVAIPGAIDSTSPPPHSFNASALWDTTQLPLQSCRLITAEVNDVDLNTTTSSPVSVVVRPAHCFNGIKDNDETGPDCGGDPKSVSYCGKCAGEACVSNELSCSAYCRSGSCINGSCVNVPRIDGVSPSSAGPGSYVTISGEFFGSNPGHVVFLGGVGPADDIEAQLAPCKTAWNTNGRQIIVLVPNDPKLSAGPISVTTTLEKTDTTADDRGFIGIFTPTNTPLPGICSIDPVGGIVDSSFVISGTGFGEEQGASKIHFVLPVGPLDDRTVVGPRWSQDKLIGKVPVAPVGSRRVFVSEEAGSSNAIDFTVQEPDQQAGPFITSVKPNIGPPRTYVTISGSHFGAVGQVIFTNPKSGATAIAGTDFPAACGLNFWNDSEVTVKVPVVFDKGTDPDTGKNLAGTALPVGPYTLKVRRAGVSEAYSNEMSFTVSIGNPPPGICGINPLSGPAGTSVTFDGDGFGDIGNTNARFNINQITPATNTNANFIHANVPGLAKTGATDVEVNGIASNPRNFQVADCRQTPDACVNGTECCRDGSCAVQGSCNNDLGKGGYAWYFSTGPIPQIPQLLFECNDPVVPMTVPSPAPTTDRPKGDAVCVNAIVTGRFSIPMDLLTLKGSNITLSSCSGSPLKCTNPVGNILQIFPWQDQAPGVRAGDGFKIIPNALLADTWYEVKLSNAIRGRVDLGNEFLPEDAAKCGKGYAYCWRFKTRANADLCQLNSLSVEPGEFTAVMLDQNMHYFSFGGSKDNACIRINTSNYNISWAATKPDGYATIVPGVMEGTIIGVPPKTQKLKAYASSDESIATARAETIGDDPKTEGPVDIVATVPAEKVTGSGQLIIDFTDPEVSEMWPACTEACINDTIGVRFNTPMETMGASSVLLPGSAMVWECDNESCLAPIATVSIASRMVNKAIENGSPIGAILRLTPQAFLKPNTYYRVIISGAIKNVSGVALTKLNYGKNYSWIFRTKQSAVPCIISNVEMHPAAVIVTTVGDRVPYDAVPKGSPDSCNAKGQELSSRNYNWTWASGNNSVAALLGGGTVVTNNPLPSYCTSQCLYSGSVGVAGSVAVCGDGILDRAHGEACDDGNINEHDGCSNRCLFEGSSQGAICGNGGSCAKDGDCKGGATCSAVSHTCVETGEACDDANKKNGDGCSDVCLLEGSVQGLANCGNGSIGAGEACDDGNTANGDGCSSACLSEGSNPGPLALCGNGAVELGEECDGGVGCDKKTCLHSGVNACADGQKKNCCGNTIPNELGKSCDDGNTIDGDGCSSRCLLEGSSPFYQKPGVPSFCGDTKKGTGEACEALKKVAVNIDPNQVAEAVGHGLVVDGAQTTTINASATGVTGTGSFVLQCGFSRDAECGDQNQFGLGQNSCCYARPTVAKQTPGIFEGANADENKKGSGVCRNPLIRVDFDRKMNIASFTGNIVVAENVPGACPKGSTPLALSSRSTSNFIASTSDPHSSSTILSSRNFFSYVVGRLEHLVQAWVPTVFAGHTPWPANPDQLANGPIPGVWCVGGGIASGTVTGIDVLNDPKDLTDDSTSLFFTLTSGALDPFAWYEVRVIGDTPNDDAVTGVRTTEGVGMNGNFSWQFHTGADICTADAVSIADVTQIDNPGLFIKTGEEHSFNATVFSNRGGKPTPIVSVPNVYAWQWQSWFASKSGAKDIVTVTAAPNTDIATVKAGDTNGVSNVSTNIKIVSDTLNKPSTLGQGKTGALKATVFLCENPGKNIDDSGTSNFVTRYCRDAGDPGFSDDLPEINIQPVSTPPVGVLREFIMDVLYGSESKVVANAIGIRVAPNPNHLPVLAWYAAQSFKGNPQATTVDGYPAIRDGRTVYVNAANEVGGKIYSNIYAISYSDGADSQTVAIFEQLLSNLQFNSNSDPKLNVNVCVDAQHVIVRTASKGETPCSADLECEIGNTCEADKDKIRRDTIRLSDIRTTETALETYHNRTGTYPTLTGGTFLRGMSVSAWPSWTENLSKEVGTLLPVDPLNAFGKCPSSFDSNTCFTQEITNNCPGGSCYVCPTNAEVYTYVSKGAAGYQFSTDLEYRVSSWEPALTPLNPNPQIILNANIAPSCTGIVVGVNGRCGDGVVNNGEKCEVGQRSHIACQANGKVGEILAQCAPDCSGFIKVPDAVCQAVSCGNGVVEGECNGGANVGAYCRSNNDCPDSFCGFKEVCDDGPANGTYGSCNSNCTGNGPYCGDLQLSGHEQCDLGDKNGQWNKLANATCSWDCRSPGPYCGDSIVDVGPEQCDRSSLSGSGVCQNDKNVPCSTNKDCGENQVCGNFCDPAIRCSSDVKDPNACAGKKAGDACNNLPGICTSYSQIRTRPCGKNSCVWADISACEIIGSCGDGKVQGSEECDDGNKDSNDACRNDCRKNVCGDGAPQKGVEQCDFGNKNGAVCLPAYGGTCNYCSKVCTFVTQTGAFCGDGVVSENAERCDATANPQLIRRCTKGNNPCTTDAECAGNGGVCGPVGFVPNGSFASLCGQNCKSLCPPDYSTTSLEFPGQDPAPPVSSVSFLKDKEIKQVTIPACRVGGSLSLDVLFGKDVVTFPSPMDVLLVLDDTGSMKKGGSDGVKKALCGSNNSSCDKALDPKDDGIIMSLFKSRKAGDVRIGILDFADTTRYRTWKGGQYVDEAIQGGADCEAIAQNSNVPYFTHFNYENPDQKVGFQNADNSGFLGEAAADKLRTVVKSQRGVCGTKAFIPLKTARNIMNASTATTKMVIFLSDGALDSTDCNPSPGNKLTDCASTYAEALTMNAPNGINPKNDGVYLFTIAIGGNQNTVNAMTDIADKDTGNLTFHYSGQANNLGSLFQALIAGMGVKLDLGTKADFSDPNTFDETTVISGGYGIPIMNTKLVCDAKKTSTAYIRALYGSNNPGSPESKIIVSNARYQYCPAQ